ncbi:hypothetical protein VPH35_125386 [Triticum aestivum]
MNCQKQNWHVCLKCLSSPPCTINIKPRTVKKGSIWYLQWLILRNSTMFSLVLHELIRSAGKILITATKKPPKIRSKNRCDVNVSVTLTQAAHPRVVSRPATLNGGVDLAQHWGFPSSQWTEVRPTSPGLASCRTKKITHRRQEKNKQNEGRENKKRIVRKQQSYCLLEAMAIETIS